MAEQDDTGAASIDTGPIEPRLLPLNSRRMTGLLLRQLAVELRLPTSGTVEDTRQLIIGKLEEMGKEPMNVQVRLQDTAGGLEISLQDADGIFLKASPEESPLTREREDVGQVEAPTEEGESLQSLRQQLKDVCEEKEALEEEVSSLRQAVESEKARVRDLWRTSCAQLANFDATLTSKDEEVAALKRQLEALRTGS